MATKPPVVDIEIDEHTLKLIGDIPRWIEEARARELDPYKYVASGLFYVPYDKVTFNQRYAVKSLVYAHLYNRVGMAKVDEPICSVCKRLYCHHEYHDKETQGSRQRS